MRRDRLEEFVDVVHAARRVHPAGGGIEPLIDEDLPPRHRAVRVEPLVAHHLQLGAEVEGRVRVDPEQRVAIRGEARRNGDAVGA